MTGNTSHGRPTPSNLPRLATFGGHSITEYRDALSTGTAQLEKRFRAGDPVAHLVKARAQLVDHLLIQAWQGIMTDATSDLALVAVGGYGRGELHPYSDIDVMLLLPKGRKEKWRTRLERFVAFLWDIGLDVGHSVRTIADCVSEARRDVTVTTNLMETRLLDGSEKLFATMRRATSATQIWPPKKFFAAKLKEQQARHGRYSDTAYNLEPNVKGSPGGLRDIQMVGWVTARQFGNDSLAELKEQGFLTSDEFMELIAGRNFLWRIRFALHCLTNRREDRLLFEHQIALAKALGYSDIEGTLAVEQLMQDYYRTVMKLLRLNEMLLQLYQELLQFDHKAKKTPINDRFHIKNRFLCVNNAEVFEQNPSAILEIFIILQQKHRALSGVSASTLRLLEKSLHRIDESFRNEPANQALFLEIIRAQAGVTHELRRMNRYDILGRYIPAFGKIVGRMQYDLFHAYTVDAHTLFVVSNLRRFALSRFDHEFPRCSEIMQSLPKPELAYLGGIFHDIAKGRGGDHSILGVADAHEFCQRHRMSEYDTHLVGWLVEHHLLLSTTAQKKDISDPDTVSEFASIVGDTVRLDYLYVLTVADVRGTNPKLWNSWKSALFEDLYLQTRRVLERGLENPINREELVNDTKQAALKESRPKRERIEPLWEDFDDEYFLRHSAGEVAWHTALLLKQKEQIKTQTDVLVDMRDQPSRGGNAILLYTLRNKNIFSIVTRLLDQLGLTVLEAQINTTRSGASLDTFVVLDNDGKHIRDKSKIKIIKDTLREGIANDDGKRSTSSRRLPRQLKAFSTPVAVSFSQHQQRKQTIVELIAPDYPGLLGAIGGTFRELGIDIHTAKITTVGEKAEDTFFVTTRDGDTLNEELLQELRESLKQNISKNRPS